MVKLSSQDPQLARPTRRDVLGVLGLGAAMFGLDIAPGSALGQSDPADNVLTESAVLRDPEIPVAGKADGGITIVGDFDYNCPHFPKGEPGVGQGGGGGGKGRAGVQG